MRKRVGINDEETGVVFITDSYGVSGPDKGRFYYLLVRAMLTQGEMIRTHVFLGHELMGS